MKRAELVSTFLKEDEHKHFSLNSIVGVHVSRRCHKCRKMNHFSRICRGPEGQKKQVNTLDDCDSDTELMFIGAISAEKDWVKTVSFRNVQELLKLILAFEIRI